MFCDVGLKPCYFPNIRSRPVERSNASGISAGRPRSRSTAHHVCCLLTSARVVTMSLPFCTFFWYITVSAQNKLDIKNMHHDISVLGRNLGVLIWFHVIR